MNARRLISGLLLTLLASASVQAQACKPRIEQAWVRAAPPGATSLAGYLLLQNLCATEHEVVAVESRDFAMAMIHRSVVANGVSKMRGAGPLRLTPGAVLSFAPGGLHIMLMQPARQFNEGEVVRLRLVLRDGQRVYAEFPVQRSAPK